MLSDGTNERACVRACEANERLRVRVYMRPVRVRAARAETTATTTT